LGESRGFCGSANVDTGKEIVDNLQLTAASNTSS
jgi:hypothetical protein